MSAFDNATLMITGGTGSFGSTVLKHFLDSDLKEIRIFSRDEKKQDDIRREFQAKMPEVADKIKFYIGDVRDLSSVKGAMHSVDYIFHAAALKQLHPASSFRWKPSAPMLSEQILDMLMVFGEVIGRSLMRF